MDLEELAKRNPTLTDDQAALLRWSAAQSTPRPEAEFDHNGRYKLADPHGGGEATWTRATTLAGQLDDAWGIARWSKRQLVKGLVENPDLYQFLGAISGTDYSLEGDLLNEAERLAGSGIGAELGTAMHLATEFHDLGLPLDGFPPGYEGDLEAYAFTLRRAGITFDRDHIERVIVCTDLGVAGTLDRIAQGPWELPRILDVKTQKSMEYGQRKIAVQLATYARADWMRRLNGPGYEPMPDVDLEWAIVAHMPVGTKRCALYQVDIRAGWALAHLAAQVKAAVGVNEANLIRPLVRK